MAGSLRRDGDVTAHHVPMHGDVTAVPGGPGAAAATAAAAAAAGVTG